jgi:hypothetical protein
MAKGAMTRQTTTRTSGHAADTAFEFSPQAADEIRAIVGGDAAAVLSVLQTLVADYCHRQGAGSPTGRRNVAETQRLTAALRSVVQCINKATPSVRERLRVRSLGDIIKDTSQWERLTLLSKQAAESLRRLNTRRGAPRKIDREWLCVEVALILRLMGGLNVRAYRAGKFANVLGIVLSEAGDRPTDLFPLVKRCARFARTRTNEELRELYEQAIRLNVSPAAAAIGAKWTPRGTRI